MTSKTIGAKGGLYCYLITPFDHNGAVDHGVLERYVDAIIEGGADGLTCVASTTEGPYLTERERFDVVNTVCATCNGRVPINVGIGALSTTQSLYYSEHAQKAGAATMMLEMQTYLPTISSDAAHQHYQDVANSSDIPLRLYNIPSATRFDMSPAQIAEMMDIEGIDSVKDATGIATRVRDIKNLCGDRFSLYCGLHYVALESYQYGAIGWEGAFHPLFTKDIVTLHRTLRNQDFINGAKLFERLEPLFTFFKYYGVPQSIKAMSSWSNIMLGKPRRPLAELTAAQTAQLKLILTELGCFD
jgi:4-hydroxy-tetrahydrodipicolinate synthase